MQVFTSIIVLIIFFLAYIISDIRNYKLRKEKSMLGLAHVIGSNSVSAILFQDNEAGQHILEELKDVAPEVVRAAIFDEKGRKFANYVREGGGGIDLSSRISSMETHYTDSVLFVIDKIINNNEFVGTVALQVELTELIALKKSKFELGVLLLLAAICISFLIGFLVQPYISRRLLNLVNGIKSAKKTENYYIPITDNGRDEISTLITAFNQLMQQVMENQQKKDEFIGIASHELKTPLTSIKGYLDLLNVMEDRQPNRQCVEKALESAHKLEKLIRDLLDVSKIQSGQLQLNIRDFVMDELIDETIASFQMVSLTHEIIKEENRFKDVVVPGDRQKIEQVLLNLLSNAVKYSPADNKVMVSVDKNDSELIVKVRDFGMGIPEEEINAVFERFYRTKNSSVHIAGLGLGLYICRDILQRHKGRIWVEREAKGSSFYFALPLKTDHSITGTRLVEHAGINI
jgi:signal transduction histidine kinase